MVIISYYDSKDQASRNQAGGTSNNSKQSASDPCMLEAFTLCKGLLSGLLPAVTPHLCVQLSASV
jgi:hypothetical protein